MPKTKYTREIERGNRSIIAYAKVIVQDVVDHHRAKSGYSRCSRLRNVAQTESSVQKRKDVQELTEYANIQPVESRIQEARQINHTFGLVALQSSPDSHIAHDHADQNYEPKSLHAPNPAI